MTATERERAVRLKLHRAEKHAKELVETMRDFWNTNPARIDHRVEGEKHDFVLRIPTPPPLDAVSLIVGDVLHNLRAALDHLVCQLVLRNGQTPGRHTYFPLCSDEKAFHTVSSTKKGPLHGIHPKAKDAIGGLRPWQGGNEALFVLHHLDIQDKHQLPLATHLALDQVSLDSVSHMRAVFPDAMEGEWPSMRFGLRPLQRKVEDGVSLFSCDASSAHFEPIFKVTIDVEVPGGTHRSLEDVVGDAARAVDAAITALAGHL